jgi:hypothetical protein
MSFLAKSPAFLALGLLWGALAYPGNILSQDPATETAKALEKLNKAVEGLNTKVDAIKLAAEANQKGSMELEKRIKTLEGNRQNLTAPATSAAVPAPPAPGGVVPVEGEPAPAPENTIVPASFWTVEHAQTLDLYRMEPRIKEATKMLSDAFAHAAAQAQSAKNAAELTPVVGNFREAFLKGLQESGRTDLTVSVWESTVNEWLTIVNEQLKGKKFAAYKQTLIEAFTDGAQKAGPWGDAIETKHDNARGVAGGGTAASAGGSQSGSSGGGGSYSTGYLPPLAAFHHAWHVRKVNRIQARIQLYNGR